MRCRWSFSKGFPRAVDVNADVTVIIYFSEMEGRGVCSWRLTVLLDLAHKTLKNPTRTGGLGLGPEPEAGGGEMNAWNFYVDRWLCFVLF